MFSMWSAPRPLHASTSIEGLCFLRGPYRGVILTVGATVASCRFGLSRLEAGSNISTVALPVIEGDEEGTQCLGNNRATWSWGYKYGDLAIQVRRVSNLRQ
jgi:hypothetical protein